MNAYRFVYGLALGLSKWLTIAFTILGLSACGTTSASYTPTIPTSLPDIIAAPRSTPAATPITIVTPSAADAWKTYRSDHAGYTIDYPPDWIISERVDPDGADVTTFAPGPDNNEMGVSVIVRSGELGVGEIPDMPNTRCQPVTVGELSGTRCFDTIAFSTTTTFAGQGRVFILASSGKRLDQNIYRRFLSSFTIKS